MIIDQNANGGGRVDYVTHLMRLFASDDEGIEPIKIDMKLNDTLLKTIKPKSSKGTDDHFGDYETIDYGPGDFRLQKIEYNRLQERFQNGETWSGFQPFFFAFYSGSRIFSANSPTYTKPILVLNDRFSGSGGDFFPSQLQAAGKAVIFGENSAGLGGPLYRQQPCLPGSQNWMRSTMGMCIRGQDGLPMENIGAVANIYRPIKAGDLKDNFKNFTRDVLWAVSELIQGRNGEQINTELQGKVRESSIPADKKTGKILLKAEKLVNTFAKSLSEQGSNEELLIAQYQELGRALYPILTSLPDRGLSILEIPIPRSILERDIILSTARSADAVVDRIETMVGLARFSADLKLLFAIKRVFKLSPYLTNRISCENYFQFRFPLEDL